MTYVYSLFKLFYIFFKIGLLTIGGGYAMIPLIHQEIIKQGWLSLEQLVDIIAIAQMTPGPFAVNTATFAGIKVAGLLGAVFSTVGVVFPSFVIVILIARYFTHFQEHPVVQSLLYGLRPAVIGLIASAALVIGKTAFFTEAIKASGLAAWISQFVQVIDWSSILIFAVVIVGNYKFKLHPILLIVISAALGVVFYGIF